MIGFRFSDMMIGYVGAFALFIAGYFMTGSVFADVISFDALTDTL